MYADSSWPHVLIHKLELGIASIAFEFDEEIGKFWLANQLVFYCLLSLFPTALLSPPPSITLC